MKAQILEQPPNTIAKKRSLFESTLHFLEIKPILLPLRSSSTFLISSLLNTSSSTDLAGTCTWTERSALFPGCTDLIVLRIVDWVDATKLSAFIHARKRAISPLVLIGKPNRPIPLCEQRAKPPKGSSICADFGLKPR